jgi:hypothetical protein
MKFDPSSLTDHITIHQLPRSCPMKSQYGFIDSAQSHVKRKRLQYGQTISMRFWWKTKCEMKQNTTVAQSLILDSLPLLNPVITHLSVYRSESRWPASGRTSFQGIITVPKRQEALTWRSVDLSNIRRHGTISILYLTSICTNALRTLSATRVCFMLWKMRRMNALVESSLFIGRL